MVTGASGGVGRATAHAFAKRGASVGLLARGAEGLEAAAAEVESFGGTGFAVPTDVADPDQVEAAAKAVEERFGPIDVWVNDAMATIFAPFAEITAAEFTRATQVTYLGTVYGTMAALKRMVPRNHGAVVQVGSALAYRAIPLQSAYCGGKFAIRGFTDSVRTELLHDKSRVWISMVQLPAAKHAPVQLVSQQAAQPPPTGAADLPAGGARRGGVLGRAPPPTRNHGGRKRSQGDRRQQTRSPLRRLVPGAHRVRLPTDRGMPIDPDRPNNLFDPVPALAATHGMFDDQAKPRSYQLWATTHRGLIVGAVGAGVLAAELARRKR